jgi:hypothetical protein
MIVRWAVRPDQARAVPRDVKPGERDVQLRRLVCLMVLAAGLAACSREVDYTPEQRACIVQRYVSYDSKQLNQCLEVCKVCMKGNAVTCNTSCRLRGAS